MFCHSLKPAGIVITTEHSWMEKCMKFGHSILSKIIKIVATIGPDLSGGAHSAPQDPLAGFKGPASKGRGGASRKGERKGKGGEGREG